MSNKRIIGRWTIGETLGKGGYSWVKKGQDIKTGKIVALKFMEKADKSWVKEQAQQVETEIEALKNIRHVNVMKLYAYNLNAQYPVAKTDKDDGPVQSDKDKDKDKDDKDAKNKKKKEKKREFIDTILLVLEFAPGGELFDILYYTSALKEEVARTYFHQVVAGLDACHKAGVIHRDLKPQNLLLDSKYNLKITDFGLSKIVQSDADAIMKTTYVGTRGYQAPELLLDKKYDLKCDVFSIGVILFILLAGYPPFEQATKSDKWFKPLIKCDYEKFWKAHRKSQVFKIDEAKKLLQDLLSYDPKKRITMDGIKKHKWMKGDTLKQKELILILRDRHRKAEKKRKLDIRKMGDLAVSINKSRAIKGLDKIGTDHLNLPANEAENPWDIYTFGDWMDIYNGMQELVAEVVKGDTEYDFDKNILNCKVSYQEANQNAVIDFVFTVKVYESKIWKGKVEESEAPKEIKDKKMDKIYIVKIERTEGPSHKFREFKNTFLLLKCSLVLKGLPAWAEKMDAANAKDNDDSKQSSKKDKSKSKAKSKDEEKKSSKEEEKKSKDEDDTKKNENNEGEVDDYDKFLKEVNWDPKKVTNVTDEKGNIIKVQ